MNSEQAFKEALGIIQEVLQHPLPGPISQKAGRFLERMMSPQIEEPLVVAFCENCKVVHGNVEPLARSHGGARESFEGLRPEQIIFFCAICKRARPFTPVNG